MQVEGAKELIVPRSGPVRIPLPKPVKADDPAVSRFLVGKFLKGLEEKRGYEYELDIDSDNYLVAIRFERELDEKHRKELQKAMEWTVEKAEERENVKG